MLKRILLVIGGVVLVFVLALGSVLFSTFTGLKAKTDNAFSDGARPIVDGYVTMYAVPTADPQKVILIDCGNDKEAKALLKGLGGKTVAAILLTHGHPDHVAGCAKFPGVPVYALKAEVDAIEGRAAFKGPLPRMFGARDAGFKVTNPVDDGADLVIEGVRVHVIATPGHTAGSAVFAINKTLFFGDAAGASDKDVVDGPPWLFSDDAKLGCDSVAALPQKLAALHVDGIENYAFAHTGPLKASPALLTGVVR